MKTKLINTALVAFFSLGSIFAQDRTTVTATNTDISDNLDLQAVASIFGESSDLEDFERRINNPDYQISNLDLNGDSRVDYLRVIEATENNTHLIILQAVLAADMFQDVATIEVERDSNNNVSVQVVGDVYMYGANYIYEPVYAVRPALFNVFWVSSYRPYYSPWYWGYYPTYYNYWAPCPVYRYRSYIHNYINVHNTYVYVNTRRSTRAIAMHGSRRQNGYERQYPTRSFAGRNTNVSNRHQLEENRAVATRNTTATRGNTTTAGRASITPATINGTTRGTTATRGTTTGGTRVTPATATPTRTGTGNTTVRGNNTTPSVRNTTPARATTPSVNSGNNRVEGNTNTPARATTTPARSNTTPRATATTPARSNSTPAVRSTPARSNSTPAVRSTPTPQATPQRQSTPAVRSTPAPQRQSAPAVRSTPSSAPRQSSTPARSASTGNRGGRG